MALGVFIFSACCRPTNAAVHTNEARQLRPAANAVLAFEQILEPGRPGSGALAFEAILKPDSVVVTPSGADHAATAAISALQTMFLLGGSFSGAIIVIVVAYQYRKHKVAARPSRYESHEDFQGFKTGLFECWDDLPLCCFVFQCPWIRWAENISMVSNPRVEQGRIPILGFWVAFAMFLALTMLSGPGGPLIWMVTACILAFFRQKFRRAFSMKTNTGSCLQDCCLYLCCCCCTIAQDARHVDEAKKQEHPAIVAP